MTKHSRTLVLVIVTTMLSVRALFAAPLAHGQGPNLGTVSKGEVEVQLSANGGTAPYTWQLVGGNLPPGVSLRTDPAPWFSPNTSAGLIGVATAPNAALASDAYAFTLRVTDSSVPAQHVDQAYTLRISNFFIKDYWTFPDLFAGDPVSRQLTTLNAQGPVSWTATSGVPPGLTVNSAGLLAGTPTTPGFYNLQLQAFDGVDTVFRGVTVGVFAVKITTPGALPNGTQSAAYDATIQASGGAGGYTFTSSFLPNGLALSESGHLSGTLNTGTGPFRFTVTATDTNFVSYTKQMVIDVLGNPAVLPSLGPYSNFFDECTIGVPCGRPIGVNSGGTAPYTWSASGLPAGMELHVGEGAIESYMSPFDAEIAGTPNALGTYAVTLTATDALGVSVSNTFQLRVVNIWKWSYPPPGTIDVPYSYAYRVLGGRLPYTFAQTGGRLPRGLTLNAGTMTVSGTPGEVNNVRFDTSFTDADNSIVHGTEFFNIGGGTSTVSIFTGDDLGTVTLGTSYSNSLFACCLPTPFTWSLVGGTLPPGLGLSAAGLLSGVPTAVGTYTFAIRAEDSANASNHAIRQFQMVVTPLSSSTAFTLPFANVNHLYSTSLSATGGTNSFTWTLVSNLLPPGLALAANGTISGTPTASGQFIFQVKATDTNGSFLIRSFAIPVYPDGVNPPLNLPLGPNFGPLLVGVFTTPLAATGGQPPYQYAYTPGAPTVPGMRVQNGAPLPTSFIGGQTAGFIGLIETPGTYSTSLRVTDHNGQFFDRAITLIVSPLNLVSLTNWPNATVGAAYSFQTTPSGGTGPYAWSATNLPPGISIDSSTGLVSGTPTAAGSFQPRITLTDVPTSQAVTIGQNLFVDPFAITTAGFLPIGVVGTAYSRTLAAPGCGSSCTWATTSSLPSGLSLSSAGTIAGTPTATANVTLVVTASGSNGTVQKLFTLSIVSNPRQALVINTTLIGDTNVGGTALVTPSASGGTPPYTWSVAAGTLPTGIGLFANADTISSSFAAGATALAGKALVAGTYAFTLAVADATGATVSRAYSWHISPLSNQYFTLPLAGTTLVYGQPYSQKLLVVGGSGHYTWTTLAPLPTGLSLDSSTGTIGGTPGVTGTPPSVPILATDDDGATFTAFITFNIAGPTSTVIGFNIGPNLGTFQQGTLTQTITPIGGTAPYTLTPLSSLPPTCALLPSTVNPGVSQILTCLAQPGSYSFTLQATDAVGNVGVRTFTFTVASVSVFNTSLADGSVGVAYSQPLLGGATAGALVYAPLSAMPPGLTVTSAGVVTGTPTQAGTFNFQASASDGSAVTTLNLQIRISSLAITDPSILPTQITIGQPFTYTFTATGGSSLVWSATNLPAGITMSAGGTLSGTFNGAPGSTFTPIVTVTDGIVAFTRRFTLFTRTPNRTVLDFAVANAVLGDVTVGAAATFVLLPTGGAPPYSWSVASGSTLPPGMSLISGSGLPLGNFTPGSTILAGVPTSVGHYSFDLIATDSQNTQVRRTFTLNVSQLAIIGTPSAATANVPYSALLAIAGGTGPYTFSVAPTSLTQEMLPPGLTPTMLGSPAALQISGTTASTGNYRFALTVQDSAGHSITRPFNLTSTNASGLQVTNLNLLEVPIGTSRRLTQTLSTNGSSTYTWSVVGGALPPGVSLSTDPNFFGGNGTGMAGVTTATGTYTYTLRATDNANNTNVADHTFTTIVTPVQIVTPPLETATTFDLPAGHTGSPYTFAFKAAGGTPPYAFTMSPFAPLPPGLSLSADGVLSGTPQSVGNSSVAVIATDAVGRTFTSPGLTLVVTAPGTPAPLLASFPTGVSIFDGSIGVPYSSGPIDNVLLRGGTAPFTWSVAPTSALPDGLALVAGNGFPTVLAGTPTTAGFFQMNFVISDSTGQTVSLSAGMNVWSAAVSAPDSLPPGIVGQPYAATIAPGGSFSIQAFPNSDLPPGLTLVSGTLVGTPSAPGHYRMRFSANASGSSVFKGYSLTIDNAAGDVPAVTIAPKPIQVYYEQGSPTPAPTPIGVNATSGSHAFHLSLAGVPGGSLSASDGTAPGAVALNLNLGGVATGTYVGVLGASAPDSANLLDSTPVIVTVAVPPPCTFGVNPTSGTVPAGGGIGSFDVATRAGCGWTATASDPSWVTITSTSSGSGPATVSFSAAANPGTTRTAAITVNGASFAITQFGNECAFTLTPSSVSVSPAGGNLQLLITASQSACSWTASGLSATPSSGTGSGLVTVGVPANLDVDGRVLTATIAGTTFTVNQAGVGCTVALNTSSASYPSAGGTGSIGITTPASCSYDTISGASWVTVSSGGSGSGPGTLVYSVDPNASTTARSASLVIGGQSFQLTQAAAACTITVDTSSLGSPYGSTGGAGTIAITTNGSNCAWTASSADSWLVISAGGGTGDRVLGVTVGSNAGSVTARASTLTIAGQTIAVSQAGTACFFNLQSPNGAAPAGGGAGSVGVVAPAACTWNAASNAPWLSITAAAPAGNGEVRFIAQPNLLPVPRSGSLTIAGQPYTVNQAAAPCSYTLNPTTTTVAAEGTTDTFTFSAAGGCTPTVRSYASWISVGSSIGGTVTFTVDPNPASTARSGVIQVDTTTFAITQIGSACGYSLNAYAALFGKTGGSSSLLGSRNAVGCTPTVGTDQPGFIGLGDLSAPTNNVFTLPFTVAPFDSVTPVYRRGTISFGGQLLRIKQSSW